MSDELLRKLILDGNGWHDEDGPVIVDGFENGTTYPVRYHWKSGGDGAADVKGFVRDNYLPMEETIRIAGRLLAESQGEAARLRGALEKIRDWEWQPGVHYATQTEQWARIAHAALASPPVPIGMGEAGQGAQRDDDGIRAALEEAEELLSAWWNSMGDGTNKGPFPGLVDDTAKLVPKLRAILTGTNTVTTPPAPKPAPIPTGMEPGQRCTAVGGHASPHLWRQNTELWWADSTNGINCQFGDRCPYIEPPKG